MWFGFIVRFPNQYICVQFLLQELLDIDHFRSQTIIFSYIFLFQELLVLRMEGAFFFIILCNRV